MNFVWYSLGIVCIKTMRAILWQKSISKWEKVSFANRILNILHALEISFIVEIALIILAFHLRQTTLEML